MSTRSPEGEKGKEGGINIAPPRCSAITPSCSHTPVPVSHNATFDMFFSVLNIFQLAQLGYAQCSPASLACALYRRRPTMKTRRVDLLDC